MSWWNDYVGLPYKLTGRDRDGLDCWGLVRLIHKEQFGNDLPSFSEHDHSHEKIREIMAEQREHWIATDSPRIGDVILFRVLGSPSHVGLYIGDKSFIHAKQGINSAIERYDSAYWEKRVIGFYRYDPDAAILSSAPHPFKTIKINRPIREGMTVAELVDEITVEQNINKDLIGGHVLYVNNELIPVDQWNTTIIESGQRIEYRALPGVDSIGDILRIVVLIAAIVVAPYLAPAAWGAVGLQLVQTGLMIAGQLLVNSIFPVRPPELGNRNTLDNAKSQLILQGGANQMNPYGSIPVVLGQFRYTPPLAAENYSDLQATTAFLRMIVCWGYGPLQVSDLRFGDVSINSFEEVQSITLNDLSEDTGDEITEFNRIYGQDVSQDIVNVELNSDGVADLNYNVNSNVCTVTYTNHPFILGQSVTLYIISGNGVGGTYTITGVTTGSFTVAMTTANTSGKISIAAQFIKKTYSVSGNICTINWVAHEYSAGDNVTLDFTSGTAPDGSYVIDSIQTDTFKVKIATANTSGNVNITTNRIIGSNWNYQTISGQSNQIIVAIHFPEGLRKMQTNGSGAGEITEAIFYGQIQYRQLDSNTLAPITGWTSIDGSFGSSTFVLGTAWYNTNTDAALEEVYQWTIVAINKTNQIITYKGSLTNNQYDDPSGQMLTNLKNSTSGFSTSYARIPEIGGDDVELWRICVRGNSIVSTVDQRSSGITGGGLTNSGRSCTIASGSITRNATNTIQIGAENQEYYKRKDAFTLTKIFNVNFGKYEVRVRRTNSSFQTYQSGGKTYNRYARAILYSVTGLSNDKPVVPPKGVSLTMTAIRIRATDQLNGNVEGLVGTVQSICKDYDYVSQTWTLRPTRNPASLFRYVLQHPANAQKVADSKINIDDLVVWHNYCRSNSFMFDMVILDRRSLLDVLRDICAAGRASPTFKDGKWSVIIDKPQSSVVQFFTPHNSWGFESSKAIPRLPHAFRVTFNNAEKSYQNDEYIVYNDGYTSSNATLFEALALPGVTTKNQIYKHARFHLAQLKLRPETYSLNVDMEHLICNRGDLVRVQHDVPEWGLQSGRIKTRISSTVLELDEAVPMQSSVNPIYAIRIRLADGSSITRTVSAVSNDGMYNSITLTTSVTETQGLAGNLFMFGSMDSETVQLIVQAIEPMDNLTAKLTLVDYSPDIYNSDDETIPEFNSQITRPPLLQQSVITEVPSFVSRASNEGTMITISPGKYQYCIKVSFSNPNNLPPQLKYIRGQVDYRSDNIVSYSQDVISSPDQKFITFSDVQLGGVYKVRLRYETADGKFGPWVYGDEITVSGKLSTPLPVGGANIVPS
jgi:sulfur carrier protein ThiS